MTGQVTVESPTPLPVEPGTGLGHWLLAWYGLVILIAATVLAAADRQIMVLLADPIRQSLGLSDTKLGLLHGVGIALFSGAAAVPLGWLADRYGRRAVLASCVIVWTGATAACGFAWDFPSLFAAAIGLGIGEAGLAPIVYGLIPDIVPPKRRVLANGIYAVAAIFGAGIGIGLSGTLIESLAGVREALPLGMRAMESWRLSFFAVALPGPIVALLILLIRIRQAASGTGGAHRAAPLGLAEYLRAHGRTVVSVFGATGLGGLGIAALAAWAPVIASRNFDGTPQQVGQGIGAAYLIGTVVGALVGGYGVRRLRPLLGVATPVRVLVIGFGLSALASAGLLGATSAMHVYVLFGLQVAFLIAGSVVAPTLLQDMTPPSLRSRVIALGSVVTLLLSALSPVLVGLLSDALKAEPRGLLISVAVVAAVSLALSSFLTFKVERRFVGTVIAIAEPPEAPVRPSSAPPDRAAQQPPHHGDEHV